jgi:hypothetical protein
LNSGEELDLQQVVEDHPEAAPELIRQLQTFEAMDSAFDSPLGFLFLGEEEISCQDAADSNDDGILDISDAVATLGALFLGQGPIPPPGLNDCGLDPTPDEVTCEEYLRCEEP